MAHQSHELMTSLVASRDEEEWLRCCVDEERAMRRDAMTSQQVLQQALVDCLQRQHQQPPKTTVGVHYDDDGDNQMKLNPVSYTHLTLPTNREV